MFGRESGQEALPWTVYRDGELYDVCSDERLEVLLGVYHEWALDPKTGVVQLTYKGDGER